MQKNVTLCDTCRETVATYKCRFCGEDICGNHIRNVSIEYQKSSYGTEVDHIMISFNHHGTLDKNKYICLGCYNKIIERFKVLREGQAKSKTRNNDVDLIDELLAVFEKYAKVEAI